MHLAILEVTSVGGFVWICLASILVTWPVNSFWVLGLSFKDGDRLILVPSRRYHGIVSHVSSHVAMLFSIQKISCVDTLLLWILNNCMAINLTSVLFIY